MENNKIKLMEMSETEDGYTLNNLSPFFLHHHIYDLLEKSKTALLIYTELQKIASSGTIDKVIDIIQNAESEESAICDIMAEIHISKQTAKHLLDSSLEDIMTLETEDYSLSIEMYEEVTRAFTIIADKQKYFDSLITDYGK